MTEPNIIRENNKDWRKRHLVVFSKKFRPNL